MTDLKESTAVFCILARDCAEQLEYNISIIENMRTAFKETHVVVVENDSRDETLAVLKKWQAESSSVDILHPDTSQFDKLDRIERIAACRNTYLAAIREPAYDYVVIIDADVRLTDVSLSEILSCAPPDFSAVFANGQYYTRIFGRRHPVSYYDLYAFLPADAMSIYTEPEKLLKGAKTVRRGLKKNSFLRCNSAFGGMAVYRYDAICDAVYEAQPNPLGDETLPFVCEHVGFNCKVREHGALYIAGDLLLYYEELKDRRLAGIIFRNIVGDTVYTAVLRCYHRFTNKKQKR